MEFNCQLLKVIEIAEKRIRYRKAHSFQAIKDINPTFLYHKLKTSIKIVLKFHVPIFYTFGEIGRQRAL